MALPVVKKNALDPIQRNAIDNDISTWMSEMKSRERDFNEGRDLSTSDDVRSPDIRITKETKTKNNARKPNKEQRLDSFDYRGWDKYDADTELSRIDLLEERRNLEAKKEQKRRTETAKTFSKEAIVNKGEDRLNLLWFIIIMIRIIAIFVIGFIIVVIIAIVVVFKIINRKF